MGWVRSFSVPLPEPRGHTLKEQFLLMVVLLKFAQDGYPKSFHQHP